MEGIRAQIAERLVEGPAWLRSFRSAKPVVDAMLRDGELGLVAPPNGRARNMVALTRHGARKHVPRRSVRSLARSEREEANRLAELVSDGDTIAGAARKIGISTSRASALWAGVRAGLGWQAQ